MDLGLIWGLISKGSGVWTGEDLGFDLGSIFLGSGRIREVLGVSCDSGVNLGRSCIGLYPYSGF